MKKKPSITFAEFIREFGAVPLARLCGVDRGMPHKWAAGDCNPTLEHAEIILKAAKGRLTLASLKKGGAK